jgi:hypothetical protein
MVDRTAKLLLALIALGIWADLGLTVFRAMAPVLDYRTALMSISNNVGQIAHGNCSNAKIC